MLPSVVAQRSIPTRHPVNTCLPVATLASRQKKLGTCFHDANFGIFQGTPHSAVPQCRVSPTLQTVLSGVRARATVGVRQEIRVTSLYRARMPSGWIGLDWIGFDWTALVPSAHETFPRRVPFIYFFFSPFFLPYRGMILRVLAERESGSQHFCIFFSSRLSQLTYSLLTVFQALAWVGAWVIGVLCAMESIGRSSADRYTFFSCRQLVQFFRATKRHSFPHCTHTITQFASYRMVKAI